MIAEEHIRDVDNTYIVARRIFGSGRLYGVGKKAEDSADPQQDGEATEHLFAKLNPLRSRLGRSQLIRAVSR